MNNDIDLSKLPTERVVAILNQAKLASKRLEYEGSLYEFLKGAWPYIESAEFIESWVAEAMCEHLEAVTWGQIKRLLLNVPPRCSKTTITSICWPAWTWAQSNISYLSGPQVKFLCGSYNDRLSLMNSNKVRRLISSPFYQKYWGDRFLLREDQNSKSQFDNSAGGSLIATSVRGSLLGIGGDIIVCFPYDEYIHTDVGEQRIGDVVENKKKVNVWSFNVGKNELELKPVIGWHKNPGRPLLRISLDDGSFVECTYDHRIMTEAGYVPAMLICVGDRLLTHPSGVPAPAPNIGPPQWKIEVLPPSSMPNAIDCALTNTKFRGNNFGSIVVPIKDFSDKFFRKVGCSILECSMKLAVSDILRPGSIFQIIKSWIFPAPIFMSDLLTSGARPYKCRHDHLMYKRPMCFPVSPKAEPRVPLTERIFKDFFLNMVCLPVFLRDFFRLASDPTKSGYTIPRESNHWQPKFVKSIDFVHDVPKYTYCVTVQDNHNMCVGRGLSSIIAENCDDPVNTEEAESEADRETAERWWKEISSTRLNNPKKSAIVVDMQRLHTKDISGLILDGEEKYCHMCIPMRFDERRRSVTIVLPRDQVDEFGNAIPEDEQVPWCDPRTYPGELMWPERFSEPEVKRIETNLGPVMSSGRLQQRPVPAGGAIIKRDWWQEWNQEEAAKYGLEWHDEKGRLKEFPEFELVIGSLDTAFGEKEENDYSAMTVWGVWMDRNKNPRVMLAYAWAKRLPLHGEEVEQKTGEAKVNYEQRKRSAWGLVELVADTCRKYKVTRLLIENKARGYDVAKEINRLYAREKWGVELINPVKDKVARAHSVVPIFADGVVWAPDLQWADDTITQIEEFPKGDHDDLLDASVQAILWLRDNGILVRGEEVTAQLEDEATYVPPKNSVAELYNV